METCSFFTLYTEKSFGPMWLTVRQFFLCFCYSVLAFADTFTGWNGHCLLAVSKQTLHKYLFSQDVLPSTGCPPDWLGLNPG